MARFRCYVNCADDDEIISRPDGLEQADDGQTGVVIVVVLFVLPMFGQFAELTRTAVGLCLSDVGSEVIECRRQNGRVILHRRYFECYVI